MKKFMNFIENTLHCWKFLIVYMALTIWNAPAWCFTAFWVIAIGYVSIVVLLVVLSIIVLVIDEVQKSKARNHGH